MRFLPHRFVFLLKWTRDRLGGGAAHVPASAVWAYLAQAPAASRSRSYVESVRPAGDYVEVRLVGHPKPLYWPAEMSLESLYLVVAEQLDPGGWHNYLTEWTPLEADDVVVDCGASEGLFAFLNAPSCRRAVLFEPNPRFLASCARTFAGWENVDIVPCALGSKAGKTFFKSDGIASRFEEGGELEVEIRTLDEVAASLALPVSFIKADLEGAEIDFLNGARETIATHKPKIAITTYHVQSHAREIEALLKSLCPRYKIRVKGYHDRDWPLMLHASI